MKQEIQKAFSQVAATLKETITDVSESAKEKTIALLESWLDVFPELESIGFEISSFGVVMAISPALEVELIGPAGLFDEGRMETFREAYKDNSHMSMVLRAIRTSKTMYHKLGKEYSDEILLKIKVKIPPEVGVFFGKPSII